MEQGMTDEERKKLIALLEAVLLGIKLRVTYNIADEELTWYRDLKRRCPLEHEKIHKKYSAKAEKLCRQREADGSWEAYKQTQIQT